MMQSPLEQSGQPHDSSVGLLTQSDSAMPVTSGSPLQQQQQEEQIPPAVAACVVRGGDGAPLDCAILAEEATEQPTRVSCDAAAAADSRRRTSDANGRPERPPPLRLQQPQRLLVDRSLSPRLESTSSTETAEGGSCQPLRSNSVADHLLMERQPSCALPPSLLDGRDCNGSSSSRSSNDSNDQTALGVHANARRSDNPHESPNLAANQTQHHCHAAANNGDLGQPIVAEEYIVRVRGLVMERDKATDLWTPVRYYPWCIVGLLQKYPVYNSADCHSPACSLAACVKLDESRADSLSLSNVASSMEYVIRGRRLFDSQEIISCPVNMGLQYSVANPTFHHWITTDGTNRACGVMFANASDAARFEKHVRRALSHVSSCPVLPKNAATVPEGVAATIPEGVAPQVIRSPLVSAYVADTYRTQERFASISAASMASPAVAPATAPSALLPAKAIGVNGIGAAAAAADDAEESSSSNNNSWPPPPVSRRQQTSDRFGSHHLAATAAAASGAASGASSRDLASKAARSAQQTIDSVAIMVPRRAAPRTSTDDGHSAMYDYRTGELPGLPTVTFSSSADGCAGGTTSLYRNRPVHQAQPAQSWPASDSEQRRQLSLQCRQPPQLQQQMGAAGRSAAPRDYRHVDGVEARRALPVDDLDSHLVELKLPMRATKASGKRQHRCASSPRLRRLCCLGSSPEDSIDNQLHRRPANGSCSDAISSAEKRSNDHGFCCTRTGRCFSDDGSLPSDGCDDNGEAPPALPSSKRDTTQGSAGGDRDSRVARFFRRLFCCCWRQPRCGSVDRHRLRSSVSSTSSSSAADRPRGLQSVDGAANVLSPLPSRRLATAVRADEWRQRKC